MHAPWQLHQRPSHINCWNNSYLNNQPKPRHGLPWLCYVSIFPIYPHFTRKFPLNAVVTPVKQWQRKSISGNRNRYSLCTVCFVRRQNTAFRASDLIRDALLIAPSVPHQQSAHLNQACPQTLQRDDCQLPTISLRARLSSTIEPSTLVEVTPDIWKPPRLPITTWHPSTYPSPCLHPPQCVWYLLNVQHYRSP